MSDAITREEKLMEAIATGSPSNIKPITREEMFLAKAGGQDVETPEPITRREKLLQGIIDNGSGGSGDTGGGTETLDALIDGSITEIVSNVESVRNMAFNGCSVLKTAICPLATHVGESAFSMCVALTTIELPQVIQIGRGAFNGCAALKTIKFPRLTAIEGSTFYNCSLLTTADFSKVAQIAGASFTGCKELKSLILRTETICALNSTGAFTYAPIEKGTGYIYVPRALVDSYKSATNWSTYASQFRALEDYTVDGTITGELDESKI